MRAAFRLGALVALWAGLPQSSHAAGDEGHASADIGGTVFSVYTYAPRNCVPRGIIIVFHGHARNARTYRDDTEPLADALCARVFAPRFDEARFPNEAYQRGGVTTDPASIAAAPVSLVPGLIAWARQSAGQALPVMLLGHSAGAQFLSRVAAYVPTQARAIVIADPSTWVMPDTGIDAPYGGRFMAARPGWLAAYLAQPVAVVLGGDDVTAQHHMVTTPVAEDEGANRLARGENAFATAQAAARRLHVRCAWTQAIVPGVGHDAAAIFSAPAMLAIGRSAFGINASRWVT